VNICSDRPCINYLYLSKKFTMSSDNEDDPMEMDEESADKRNQIQVSLTPSTSRLFRVYRTISSMLNKRGYMIPREYLNMTPVTFVGKFGMDPPREGLTMLVENSDDESDQLFVFFPGRRKSWCETNSNFGGANES